MASSVATLGSTSDFYGSRYGTSGEQLCKLSTLSDFPNLLTSDFPNLLTFVLTVHKCDAKMLIDILAPGTKNDLSFFPPVDFLCLIDELVQLNGENVLILCRKCSEFRGQQIN